MISVLFYLLIFATSVKGKIYFKEEFSDINWHEIWTSSEDPETPWGKFVRTSGKNSGDAEISKGIQTSDDARFYGLSTKFEPFSTDNKVLVLQYTVKHERKLDCGGEYIKLFNCSLDPKNLHGGTPYLIMFGPDICGNEKKKIHVIFNYKDKYLSTKKKILCKADELTHLYTLILKPDNTYSVKIDNQIAEEGDLESDWDFLLPRNIQDLSVEKPDNWVDDPEIEDPDDWDQLEFIPDNDAGKPVDWDDDIDGDWEPSKIRNPDYKGKWKPRLIANPDYKGPWIPPEIPNPHYKPDPNLYRYEEICGVGFDLWQVKSGSIFDNILISDDEEEAFKHSEGTWAVIIEKEKEMKEKLDKERADSGDLSDDMFEDYSADDSYDDLDEEDEFDPDEDDIEDNDGDDGDDDDDDDDDNDEDNEDSDKHDEL